MIFNKNCSIYKENGYIIDCSSHTILHVPKGLDVYELPNSALNISECAMEEIKKTGKELIVPGSFKVFKHHFKGLYKLERIVAQEGIEEINCTGIRHIDYELPSTIKKLGYLSYPKVKDLVIPSGVEEIGYFFATHDYELISAEIPGTVKLIHGEPFNQCANLESIIIHEGVENGIKKLFGTNSLQKLCLPSTYNGCINFYMDKRTSNVMNKPFNEAANSFLSIYIKRNDKIYEFKVKHKDINLIDIDGCVIKLKIKENNLVFDLNKDLEENQIFDMGAPKVYVKSRIDGTL